jgi:hypothetical protein
MLVICRTMRVMMTRPTLCVVMVIGRSAMMMMDTGGLVISDLIRDSASQRISKVRVMMRVIDAIH